MPGVDRRALLGDLGVDPVDVEVDVDAVGDRLLVPYSMTRFWLKKPKVCFPGSRSAR